VVAAGETSKAISQDLGISEPTVKWHVSKTLKKLGAQSRSEAVAIALARGYLLPNNRR
jgi:DNA-binding NarL/FixJ family response regulator